MCGISAVIAKKGRVSGAMILQSAQCLENRGNFLGGGFAAQGLYPNHADDFALHILGMNDPDVAEAVHRFLSRRFEIVGSDRPKTFAEVERDPGLHRFFVQPPADLPIGEETRDIVERRYVADAVHELETAHPEVFVSSSGKNFAVFKGLGSALQVGRHYGLDRMEANYWIHHDRFPTNTSGDARSAHPHVEDGYEFAVVHNGEIASYGTNKIYLESHGYRFPLSTDTLVIAKALRFLWRRGIDLTDGCRRILCAPSWDQIDAMEEPARGAYREARIRYGSLLLDGPFSICVGFHDTIMGLRDRKGLRPLVWGVHGDFSYLSSEESSIRVMSGGHLDESGDCAPGQPVYFRSESDPSLPDKSEPTQLRLGVAR